MKKGIIKPLVIYFIVWILSVALFWIFNENIDALTYSIIIVWIAIPLTTLITSFMIGISNIKNGFKYLWSVFYGIMFLLLEYFTFSMANNLEFNKINAPSISLLLIGIVLSLVGVFVGIIKKTK